jgi:hypothetical protein
MIFEFQRFPHVLVARMESSNAFNEEDTLLARDLSGDPGWAAALTILSFPPLAAKARPFIRLERRRIEFDDLIEAARAWSSGERLLVDAAMSLFNGRRTVDLSALMGTFDEAWADALIAGLLAYKKRIHYQPITTT